MYSTDLSENEWARLRSHLPALPKTIKTRAHSLREIFDAIFYVLKTGCPWRLLPGDFPPWQSIFYHFRRFRLSGLWHLNFRTLRTAERERMGRNPAASAAIVDSQSVKTFHRPGPYPCFHIMVAELSGRASVGARGWGTAACFGSYHLAVGSLG